jgi:thiosulfate dehydrogenase [quinone] large subunit
MKKHSEPTQGTDRTNGVGTDTMDRTNRGIFFLRVILGGGFLFAGLDKFFMWASGTPFTAAGFLQFGTNGQWLGSDPKSVINPTHGFWVSLAGNAGLMSVIDTLVVFGEIAIGVALILGLATRFAGLCGTLMMVLFYVAQMSFANGPFNEQLVYGAIAVTIAYVGAGAYALDSVVSKIPALQRVPVVKYALG